jgi:cell division protein FtsQ
MAGEGRIARALRPWLPSRADARIAAQESAKAIHDAAIVARKTSRKVRRRAREIKDAVVGESVYIPRLSAQDDDASNGIFARLERRLPSRRIAYGAVALFLAACAGTGIHIGGGYSRAIALYGKPQDVAARLAGFEIDEVAVTGTVELTKQEVVDLSGVTNVASLAFLDADAVKKTLIANPLIADADVRKLFPNRLSIAVVERTPFALWQRNGDLALIAQDGAVIETMKDDRFARLPHVVGDGANLRAGEYAALLAGAGSLKPKIRAGVLVSQRRWNLKLVNGVDIKLPEHGAAEALRELARLDREAQVLDKAILSVDLRAPGRAIFRLTEEAAANRRDAIVQRNKKDKA